MTRARRACLIALLLLMPLTGCMTHRHTVGGGPQGTEFRSEHTWYALWGLVPVNSFDTRELVGSAQHYRLETGMDPLDVIVNLFTFPFTFVRRTTTVEK